MKKLTPPVPSFHRRQKASLALWHAREHLLQACRLLEGTDLTESLAEILQRVTRLKERLKNE
jgi:hypothetical protein